MAYQQPLLLLSVPLRARRTGKASTDREEEIHHHSVVKIVVILRTISQ